MTWFSCQWSWQELFHWLCPNPDQATREQMINYVHKLAVATGVNRDTHKFLPRRGLPFDILPSGASGCPLWSVSKATLGITVPLRLYLGQLFRRCWRRCVASEAPGHEQKHLLLQVLFSCSLPPNSLSCPVPLLIFFIFVPIGNKSWNFWQEVITLFHQKSLVLW